MSHHNGNISPTWYIDMLGENGNVVAAIANQEAGSNITKIDVKTTSGLDRGAVDRQFE